MEDKLIALIADIFQLDSIHVTDELAMHKLEIWDSLKHMELIVAIEDEFQLRLDFEEIVQMQNVAAIKAILSSKNGTSA